MILNEVMKETADAIREKTGKSELIKPVDFATEIKGITAGGSGESGGSHVEYLDLRGFEAPGVNFTYILVAFSDFVKSKTESQTVVGVNLDTIQMLMGGRDHKDTTCVAVAVDFSRRVIAEMDGEVEVDMSIFDMLGMVGITPELINAIPRITKEQFYDLNA